VVSAPTLATDAPDTERAAPPSRRGRTRLVEAAIVFAVCGAVAVAVTWPLVAHLNHAAEDPFDPRFQAWTIDWVQHSIKHPSHLYDANIFHPDRATLAYSDSLIGVGLLLLPARWLGMTPIGVFNLAILLGFALSAASGYLFGRVVSGRVVVGAMVGAAFAFGEFGAYESAHVQTVFRPGVALAAALAWVLAGRAQSGAGWRRLWAPAVGLAAVIAWQCSVSFYTGPFALAAAVVILAVRARHLGKRGWLAAGAALGVAASAALLLATPYLGRHAAIPNFHWTIADLRSEGADFLHADSRLAVWGGALGRGRPWPQFPPPLFPGATLLVLGVVGLVAGLRGGRDHRRMAAAAVALLAVGAVVAIGTSDIGWRQYAPYRVVFAFAPGGRALRATFRAWMIGLLGLGLLAGLGVEAAIGWLRRRQRPMAAAVTATVVAAAAVMGVLAEGWRHRTHLAPVSVQPVDLDLAHLPQPGGVLYLPVGAGASGAAYLTILAEADVVYRVTASHRVTPNGYSGFFPDSYFRMTRLVQSLPGQPGLGYLQSIGVRFVVVHVPAILTGGPWAALLHPDTARPLRLVGRFGDDLLLEVPAR
jgi:hypothetical protein